MLFTKGLIKLFTLNLQLFNLLGSYLYKINPITYKLNFDNSKSLKVGLLSKCAVVIPMYALMSAQLVKFRDIFPNVQIYEGILYNVHLYAYIGTMYIYYSRGAEVVELFNFLVELEQQLIQSKLLLV